VRINLGEDEQPEIGLIALIDCIFFLLMYFMIATSFKQPDAAKQNKELPVVLPTAQISLDRASASAAPLIIGVDRSGVLYVDGSKVTTQGMLDMLKDEAARNPQRSIRIDGDQSARYQDIVRVLEMCQFEGFTKISMHTR
jgi:biopolymer transport protein ExbD